MERLSNSIANKIATELNLDNDNREVIAYGTFALLQMALSIILVVIFGWAFHIVVEVLIISFTTSILRKYSGGVHASSPGICAFVGTVFCVGQALLVVLVIGNVVTLKLVLLLGVITFVVSYFVVYKLAPVDSAAKPIKREEKRNRMKKKSILVLCFYLAIVVLNIMLYIGNGEKQILIYSICIYVGILWQVFTLTSWGQITLGKIDSFFNHIIIFIERRISNERIK